KHKEFVHKENEYAGGKLPESSLSDVLNGEFSCDISRPNEHTSEDFVENELESGDGKLYYSDHKDYTSSCMTQLLQEAVPDQPQMVVDYSMDLNLPNFNESFTESQVNDNAGFDFDNNENHSLNDMVRTKTQDIHLDELLSEK
nr:hypothetical protein [Tanacetum cinerariifolium]